MSKWCKFGEYFRNYAPSAGMMAGYIILAQALVRQSQVRFLQSFDSTEIATKLAEAVEKAAKINSYRVFLDGYFVGLLVASGVTALIIWR
jgi:hypothetical protein